MKKNKFHDKSTLINALVTKDIEIRNKKDLATLNFELQLFKNSEILFEEILTYNNKDLEAIYYLGLIAALNNDLIASLNYYSTLRELYPNFCNPVFFNNYANVLKQSGDYTKALEYYNNTIALDSCFTDAYFNRGLLLYELGQTDEAVSSFENVLFIDLKYSEALFYLGIIFKEKKHHIKSINYFKNLINLDSNFKDAYFELALISQEINRLEDSIFYYNKLIELDPLNYQVFYNLGNLYFVLLKYEDSLINYDYAISLNIDFADAFSNKGNVLMALKQWDNALHCYETAISIDNLNKVYYFNLGNLYQEFMFFDKSLLYYDKAISLDSNYHEAIFNKSLVLLLTGNFELGWNLFEHRPYRPTLYNKQNDQYISFQPEYFNNKKIFIISEQGLGDTIQFCRYANLLQQLGAKVTLEVDLSLINLLKNLSGVDFIAKGHDIHTLKDSYDYHIPLLSLPLLFKTNFQNIPFNTSYLTVSYDKKLYWSDLLGAKAKFRVGIAWSGNAGHKNDTNRSIDLEQFICRLPRDFDYISIQKDIKLTDKKFLQPYGVQDFSSYINDFTDTAALCELMDIIITVDTSVAHLAGSMGLNTFLVVPFIPDWRWLLDRDDSPWYKSIRIYRQNKDRRWESVFDKISEDLKKLSSLFH